MGPWISGTQLGFPPTQYELCTSGGALLREPRRRFFHAEAHARADPCLHAFDDGVSEFAALDLGRALHQAGEVVGYNL